MIKLWIKLKKEDKILSDEVCEIETLSEKSLHTALALFAEKFDVTTPVVLSHHLNSLKKFNRTVFLPRDFVCAGDFTCLEIERIL